MKRLITYLIALALFACGDSTAVEEENEGLSEAESSSQEAGVASSSSKEKISSSSSYKNIEDVLSSAEESRDPIACYKLQSAKKVETCTEYLNFVKSDVPPCKALLGEEKVETLKSCPIVEKVPLISCLEIAQSNGESAKIYSHYYREQFGTNPDSYCGAKQKIFYEETKAYFEEKPLSSIAVISSSSTGEENPSSSVFIESSSSEVALSSENAQSSVVELSSSGEESSSVDLSSSSALSAQSYCQIELVGLGSYCTKVASGDLCSGTVLNNCPAAPDLSCVDQNSNLIHYYGSIFVGQQMTYCP